MEDLIPCGEKVYFILIDGGPFVTPCDCYLTNKTLSLYFDGNSTHLDISFIKMFDNVLMLIKWFEFKPHDI